MAKVKSFDRERVKALSGIVDFYYWKGIPVARKWPDWSKFKPSANQKLSMAAFSKSRSDLSLVTDRCRDYWRAAHVGVSGAWLDIYSARYLSAWKVAHVYPDVVLDIDFTPPASDARLCVKTISGGAVKVCVFKSAKTVISVTKCCKGKPSKCWGPVDPESVWCGMATVDVEKHVHVVSPSWRQTLWRNAMGTGATAALSCAAAWASLWVTDWEWDGNVFCGVILNTSDMGPFWMTVIDEFRLEVNPRVEAWWSAFPDTQPERLVFSPNVTFPAENAGSVFLPAFDVSEAMDHSPLHLEMDVSDVSFPPNSWWFDAHPYRETQPHCCCPGEWPFCETEARIGQAFGGCADWYAGGSDWACITIPEAVFSGEGKFWAAVCDDAGVPIPGPFIPLK